MEYTSLGDTGVQVSRLCLGCGGLGYSDTWKWNLSDRAESLDLLEQALDTGINFLDTANTYSAGESEELVGEAIDGIREDVVLASKVGEPVEMAPNRRGLSRKHIHAQLEESLDRLDTDYLDIYYLHQWDYDTPIEETLSTFDRLIDEGLVRYIGASNLAGWRLMKALATSDLNNLQRVAVIQPEYNLIRRHEEENLLPVAAAEGLGVASYAPLASGFLTGEYDRADGRSKDDVASRTWRDLAQFDEPEYWDVLETVRSIAEREGVSPVQVSVAWLLAKDVVDAPIIGPQSIDQLETYCGALEIELTETDIDRLEAPIEPTWNHSMVASARW